MRRFILSLIASATLAYSAVLNPAFSQSDLSPRLPATPTPEATPTPLTTPPPQKKKRPAFELAKDLDGLFNQLKRTSDRKRTNLISEAIWKKWQTSDSKSVDLLSGWARDATGRKQFAPALDLIDQVIVLRPGYAEGYNQRATLHYMMENYGKSIADIEQTLALEPRHFGALSGLAIILERVEEKQKALSTWKRVLTIYPTMKSAQDAVIRLEEELAGRGI